MNQRALGLIETLGFVGVIEAADAAVKAAAVEISAIEKIEGGLISIRLLGDVGAVQVAVQAGVQAAQQVGHVVAQHVIPNPHEDLVRMFNLGDSGDDNGEETPSGNGGNPPPPLDSTNLEDLSVIQLRQLARSTPGLAIQGRQISMANREQLTEEIRRARST